MVEGKGGAMYVHQQRGDRSHDELPTLLLGATNEPEREIAYR